MPSPASLQTDILPLLEYLDNLKHLKRTGWVHFGVPEPETVASHMYRMGVLAMTLLKDEEVDALRCVQIALVHDIGEAIVGDLTPRCGVSEEEKHRLEEEAVRKIAATIPHMAAEVHELWREYEEAKTPEAKAVKQLDKLDMIAQAAAYERKFGLDLSEFFDSTAHSFSSAPFVQWNAEIRRKRAENRTTTQSTSPSS